MRMKGGSKAPSSKIANYFRKNMMKFSQLGIARIWRSLTLAIVMSLTAVQAIAEPDKNYLCFSLNGGFILQPTACLQLVKEGNPDPIEL